MYLMAVFYETSCGGVLYLELGFKTATGTVSIKTNLLFNLRVVKKKRKREKEKRKKEAKQIKIKTRMKERY